MNLIEMGRRFHEHAQTGIPFDERSFAATLSACEAQGGLFVTEGGFLAACLSPAWFNRSHLIAVELAWWSEDGKGFDLLSDFERWAQDAGAKDIRMSTLDERAQRVLKRRGYKHAEYGIVKVMPCQ